MDFNGERRRTPLIEEPRRPPWMLIVLVVGGVALLVAAWVALGIRLDVRPADQPPPVPVAAPEHERRVVEQDKTIPVARPEDLPLTVLPPGSGPRWAHQGAAEYPEHGWRAPGGKGRVTLNCVVQADRSLGDCRVLREEPQGYGFGASAIEAAGRSRLTDEARPGARITYTVRYVMAED